jgi:hypothetical protein
MRLLIQAIAGPLAIGIVLGIAAIISTRRGRRSLKPAPVVDRRTWRLAQHRIPRLIAAGDALAAHHQIAFARQWLRGEIHTGPKRRRVRYSWVLEQLDLTDEPLADQIHGGAHP